MNFVLSPTSLDLLLAADATKTEAWPPSAEWCSNARVASVNVQNQATFLVTLVDTNSHGGRLILEAKCAARITNLDSKRLRATLERLNRLLHASRHPPLRLPLSYSEYHAENKVTFFAVPPGAGSWRWIAATLRQQSGDVYVFDFSEPDSLTPLHDVTVDTDRPRQLISGWTQAIQELTATEFAPQPLETGGTLQPSVDLDAITFEAVTKHRDFSTWLDLLTEKQRSFVENDIDRSIRLRGPAGSGKTLALAMKAVREAQRAQDLGKPMRILFATASWAMAEQADAIVRQLDLGESQSIDVLPLIQLAKDLPGVEATVGSRNLGEDSLDGRRQQIELIDSLVSDFCRSSWPFLKRGCGPLFTARFDASPKTTVRKALIWDLIHEFSSVIAANGILPGTQAERKYLEVQRKSWMMPLGTLAEKRIILKLYIEYVDRLRKDGLRSIDQIVSDCLNYVETFAWNIRRRTLGYDALFVDEFHLFSEPEQILLHSLSVDPDSYARLYTASDPDQSPFEYFLGVATKDLSRHDSGELSHLSDRFAVVDLPDVHRFTPEILALVRHVHNTFPVFDLGTNLRTDLSDVVSRTSSGEKPIFHSTLDRSTELHLVADRVDNLLGQRRRLAVIAVDPSLLDPLEVLLQKGRRVSVLRSRDDIDSLRYTKTGVTLAAAEYVAGLQFDSVIVCGLPKLDQARESAYEMRRSLSLIYLALTRAVRHVEVIANSEIGLPEVFEKALAARIVRSA